MFKKILVPLDGSDLAKRALTPALALANQVNGKVLLVSASVKKHVAATAPPAPVVSGFDSPDATSSTWTTTP